MSTLITITVSGMALGAVYFLVSSGLSLIYGLMDVLNFAHGAFLTVGAFAGWMAATHLPGGFPVALAAATLGGAVFAGVTEVVFVRRLYASPVSQILVTIGIDLAVVSLLLGVFGADSRQLPAPGWLSRTVAVGSGRLPLGDIVAIGVGLAVLFALTAFLRRTRYGLIIRAGAENRAMVQALGIDVGRAFTLVFVLGGAAAGLAGMLNATVLQGAMVDPSQGDQLLIFAFIIVVIGGLGSLTGSAAAALLVGLFQVYIGYYVAGRPGLSELGNLSVVALLAVVLLFRPRGLLGQGV